MSHQITKRFIGILRPGFIPLKKGPFKLDGQVSEMLKEAAAIYPTAQIVVMELTWDGDIWLSSPQEWSTVND